MTPIHPHLLAAVVWITTPVDEGNSQSQGTGFILARPNEMPYREWNEETDGGSGDWHFWIVTCAHVIPELGTEGVGIPEVWVNQKDYESRIRINQREWYGDRDRDIAITRMDIDGSNDRWENSLLWAWKPERQILRSSMERKNIWPGHGILMVGFPAAVGVGGGWNTPIVRQGVIAENLRYRGGTSHTFFIDVPTTPGSSGSPIITTPTGIGNAEERVSRGSAIIGMACARKNEITDNEGRTIDPDIGVAIGIEEIHKLIDEYVVVIAKRHAARKTETATE